jgi:hypothetical protein
MDRVLFVFVVVKIALENVVYYIYIKRIKNIIDLIHSGVEKKNLKKRVKLTSERWDKLANIVLAFSSEFFHFCLIPPSPFRLSE